jgi:hypothetical protein
MAKNRSPAVLEPPGIERAAQNADTSGMDPFWLFDPLAAGVEEAQSAAAASQPGGEGTAPPFLTGIKQLLGEEAEPDAAFFIECWTAGVPAALEDYLRRRQAPNSRKPEMAGSINSFNFTPFFGFSPSASGDAAWPPRASHPERVFREGQEWTRDEQEPAEEQLDPVEVVRPLTLESACRVLGVTVTSTREQIRTAYRKMASRHHPDRLARGAIHQQKLASDRMATINEAYRLLCAAPAER